MVSDAVDPRRVRRFYQPEQQPPDYLSVLSLGFGVVGLMFKQTLFSWLSVFCCLSSVANVKVSALDVKQITCSIMFALMGLFMNYFGAATLKTKGAAMAMPADGPGSPPTEKNSHYERVVERMADNPKKQKVFIEMYDLLPEHLA